MIRAGPRAESGPIGVHLLERAHEAKLGLALNALRATNSAVRVCAARMRCKKAHLGKGVHVLRLVSRQSCSHPATCEVSKERERVPGYLLVGRQLSARAPRSGGALWDCWMSHVMAFAVDRN